MPATTEKIAQLSSITDPQSLIRLLRMKQTPAMWDIRSVAGLADRLAALEAVATFTQTPAYAETNVTTTRAFDANAVTIDTLADVLGTLIDDLRDSGVVGT